MRKFLLFFMCCLLAAAMPVGAQSTYQLANANFEDWSGAAFDGEAQPKGWNASNVEQVGLKFNFAHKEAGHNGGYCMMVQDQSVGALGITETSPGYFSIGQPWAYIASITAINQATAGCSGGQSWTHRPDSMSVWIRRTGSDWDKEDFYLLYYAWVKEAHGTSYKGKNTNCTSHEEINEESDVRIAMNGNECKTTVAGEQVCEGMWRERATYNNWTNIKVPIYYFNDNVPRYMNIIFSASNYPNFRANNGLYVGNSLYVDDVVLIYSSKIQKLKVGDKEWKGFDPDNTGVQVYSVPNGTTAVPAIEAFRGAGSITNARGTTKSFSGRKLSGSEISISYGDIGTVPTTITVYAEDGSSTTTYQILFKAEASNNAKLADIHYTYTDKDGVSRREPVANFSPSTYNYKVELPYGALGVPVIDVEKQEDEQTFVLTQAASPTGRATAVVTAADGTTTATYNITFEPGKLADNTLKDIKVNGKSVPGFTSSQAVYKVSLPTSTTTMPVVEAVSAYPAGEQTIVHKAPASFDGGTYTISVTTPGNPVAKVYKLNFKLEASSYSYLSDLQVGGVTVTDFEPQTTTYYVNMPLGTTVLPAVTWVRGDEFQTVTKADLPDGAVDGTVRVTVTAGNGDQTVYKIVFSTEKSDRSTLAGILVGGTPLEGFDPDHTAYTFALPVGTTELPAIEPVLGDEYQTYSITTAGVNGKTRITVTAGDGSTTVYQIAFSVAAYTVNTLRGIYLDGVLMDGFDPQQDEYWVNLPQGTAALPAVTWELENDELQSAAARPLAQGVLNGDYKITVRPQSGASRTYVIHFSVATSSNTDLAMIYLNGVPLPGFDPEVLHYTDSLPEGVSAIPVVTFDKAEPTQRVLSVLENKTQRITVTAESGAKKEYTVDFIVRASANAYLDMIYLDSVPLPGFDRKTLEYTVKLSGSRCPVITVDKAPGQQVTITAPYGVGTAFIAVMPEQGSGNTYTITFETVAELSAQLAGIVIDGVPVPDFKADSMAYTAVYAHQQPVVTGTKKDPSQTVSVLWSGDVAWLMVADTLGNRAAYSVTFTRIYSADNTLSAVYADGVLIDGFDPATMVYAYELVPGAEYPVLTYATAENAQVVFFGQLQPGQWGITVEAENGDRRTYTVAYTVGRYSDAALRDLRVEGCDFVYSKTQNTYGTFTIPAGETLPQVTAVPEPGQSVIVYAENDSVQRVLVMAENGNTNTYTITYHRVRSNNVKLANIYIDGTPLEGFDPDVADYTVTLPRDAKTVPNVNAVPQLENQTVTTYFCRPDGVTRIQVQAQDGSTAEYTVAFPVEKSGNALLKKLTIDGELQDVNTTEFTFNVPFTQAEPYALAYEAYDGQLVHFIDAPLSAESKIIVTSEDGSNTRTYTVRYNVAVPQGENKIANIRYSYVTAGDETVNGQIEPVPGNNNILLPFGTRSFTVTEVEKTYPEQAVYLYNGGIRRGATVIAAASRDGEPDVTYTLTPVLEADTVGKLKALTFQGKPVPHFNPDVYNYMVNVTAQPAAADFAAAPYEEGKNVTVTPLDAKNKQITFTVDGGKTYSVCWYYTNYDGLFDFSGDWVTVAQGVGYKPSAAWKVPADYSAGYTWSISLIGLNLTYTTGKEVTPGGTNGVMLSTLRGAPMNGSVPGMMTLGGMAVSLTSNGNSTSSVTKSASVGTAFKNTPEALQFLVKPLSTSNISNWKMWLTMSDGTNYKESGYTGDFNSLNKWTTVNVPISYAGVGTVSKFNVMLSSCDQENAKQFGGSTVYESSVMYDNIRFVYNSELTAATVNGKPAVKDGNTFTYTLAENEVILGVPALAFTKAVPDQMQTVEWLDNGNWTNGELKARVVNYGENSHDSTVYTVVLKRTPVTTLAYTADFGAYPVAKKNDTLFVTLPYGTRQLPSMTVTPENVHQQITLAKSGNAVTVHVTAEDGTDSTAVYVFREDRTADATPESWSLSTGTLNTVDADQLIYSVEAYVMPEVEIDKRIGQTVDLQYTADGASFTVTAADGSAANTYTIHRLDPAVATSGKIDEFTKGAMPWAALGGDTYTATGAKPAELIMFERRDDRDSVVYIQTPDSMAWRVYGTETHTYVLRYPSAASSNAALAAVLVNGVPYAEFAPSDTEYTIESDSLLVITAEGAEAAQSIVTSQTATADDIVRYSVAVTAEDGVTEKTYTLAVRYPDSSDATLAAILLDDVPLADFDPAQLAYTVTIPLPEDGIKRQQPKMSSVTYIAGHKGQTVTLAPGELNGEPTEIYVRSEAGTNNTYSLIVNAEKSHNADLSGITVNGNILEQFESGRHYYSSSLKTSTIDIGCMSEDRFQTVQVLIDTLTAGHQFRYTLRVTAEDGANTANYEIMIYVENQSNDAQLESILLDGKQFEDFERTINTDLVFDGGNNNYIINLRSGTTVLPEVSAQLKMDGQTVQITQKADSVMLDVYAVDGTLNTYTLKFLRPMSKNADLSMIFLDGDSLPDFDPSYYFYQIGLPEGVHTMPEVAAQKGEAVQKLFPVEIDTDKLQATIRVQAEDPSVRENTYIIVFHINQSDADTLAMIYQDGQPMEDFEPGKTYYALSLPVGTLAFPELGWQEINDLQTVTMDTVETSANTLIRQITVTAESGKRNTYTVSYTIEKSDVDILQMIFVDQKQLPNFDPLRTEYNVTLTAAYAAELDGRMPEIDYITGDEYQTVMVAQIPEDSLSGKSLGYKAIITVTAATGKTAIYTIHYPVELSNVATLNMINVGGKPLANYDSERFAYKVEIEKEAAVPVVSVVKKEEAQTYEIQVIEDTVLVFVNAEDTTCHSTYKLTFERLKSKNTSLSDIILTDAGGEAFPASQFPFRPEVYSYIVNLSYIAGADPVEQLPDIQPVLYDSEQTTETAVNLLPAGDVQVDITVTAPNGEDQAVYTVTFHFLKPSDATLAMLSMHGEEFPDFRPAKTEYTYVHPFGTDPADYFTADDIAYTLSDSLAADTLFTDDSGVIYIVVTAQDGRTSVTYLVTQITGLDNDNALAWITIDGDTLRDFDPEVTFYVYEIFATDNFTVDAAARSANAEVDIDRFVAGDTLRIICTAADNSERTYYVWFKITQIDPGVTASSDDVLVKRIPGTNQLFVATIRSGVDFALYDRNGAMIFFQPGIPTAAPNAVEVYKDHENRDVLNDVIGYDQGLVIDIAPCTPCFYVFFTGNKKLSEGKIIFY